ncbi:glycosyltransferase [Sinorhizobium meliloti]|nr:glycosyltransferase [Sinorhizobium meliloti]WQO79272.1 glycosyltransferase [Sinorhizobium meliloti]
MNTVSRADFFAHSKVLMPLDEPTLTVIIPVRITDGRRDIFDRISFFESDSELPLSVDFLVVDDGSTDDDYRLLCERETTRVKVISTGAKYYQDFSLARARNFAAQRAKGDFVMFMDADLVPYPGFYRDIFIEIQALQMRTHVNRFLMVPVIYLTEAGYSLMQSLPSPYWRSHFINAKNADDKTLIDKHSSGTSVIVVDRHYYMARGGQDEDFQGWGFEDYEFTNRLIRRSRMFPMPENWLSMAGNFMTINAYEGWKACYRLHGDWLAAKGIYLFHAPHPIEQHYHSRKNQNEQFLRSKMAADAESPSEPEPLPDFGAGTSLLFRRNPFCWDRELAPFLGQPLFVNESEFETASQFGDFVRDSGISRVVFANPYANEALLSFYRWCRENEFPYVVCERGALPDSVYHDKQGFLSDSTSYQPSAWDHPLTKEQRDRTLSYIAEIRGGSHMLEQQSDRVDLATLKQRLGIKHGQKVLLVPFQQPNDTVIKYFPGPIGSYEAFRAQIVRLASDLGEGWKVIYKKHPAEVDFRPIPGATSAHDENVYDLLELASAVAVINSGVGIYAMMFGKPLLVFGDAWYAHDGTCFQVNAGDDVCEILKGDLTLDYERVLRFIHHLRFRFYSFGKMTSRRVRMPDGSPITATTSISYYELRGWTQQERVLKQYETIPFKAPIFDRYKGQANRQKVVKPGPVTPKPAPVAAKPAPVAAKAPSIKELVTSGRFAEAATRFEQAYKNNQSRPNFLRSAAEMHIRAGNRSAAIAHLKFAKKQLPTNRNLRRRLLVLQYPVLKYVIADSPFRVENI